MRSAERYRVLVSFEVEAESEDEAIREANNTVSDGIVESVYFIETRSWTVTRGGVDEK